MRAVVVVDGLDKVFAGPPVVTALRPCSLQISSGDYVAITGPSGSGKTTLLSILGLLEAPTSGRYLLHGKDVTSLDDEGRAAVRAHRIGFVFQAFHLVGYRSVVENVELGLLYQGVARRVRRARASAVVERVGLHHRRNALCSTLSGGEKQRVAIARALVREPSLILCDEPTGNLDSATTVGVLEVLDAVHRQGDTIVVITHDRDVAARADRILTMHDGVVAESR